MDFSPELQAACARAAAHCSRVETCSGDMRTRLREWGVSEEESASVLDYLEQNRFIDDERYARAYAKDKFRFNGWGRQKILAMLRAKHIDPEILEGAFVEIETEAYRDKLRALLTAKAPKIKARDRYDLRRKLTGFAMARGFESGTIHALLEEMEL